MKLTQSILPGSVFARFLGAWADDMQGMSDSSASSPRVENA